MGEKIVLVSGLFFDGTTEEEHREIKSAYPDKDIVVYKVIPGEAHITVYDKKPLTNI